MVPHKSPIVSVTVKVAAYTAPAIVGLCKEKLKIETISTSIRKSKPHKRQVLSIASQEVKVYSLGVETCLHSHQIHLRVRGTGLSRNLIL